MGIFRKENQLVSSPDWLGFNSTNILFINFDMNPFMQVCLNCKQILYSTLRYTCSLIYKNVVKSDIKFEIKSDQAALRVNSSSFKTHVNILRIYISESILIYLSSAHLKLKRNKSFFSF